MQTLSYHATQEIILINIKLFWQTLSDFDKYYVILTNSNGYNFDKQFWQEVSYFDSSNLQYKQQVNFANSKLFLKTVSYFVDRTFFYKLKL